MCLGCRLLLLRTVDGELNFGGINLKKYKEWINWVKITDKEPFNRDWGFEQTIMYGNQILQPPSVGNVDSGSTMIYITSEAFDVYSKSLPGSKIDPKTELLEIPEGSLGQMQSLFFVINGVSYEFPPSAQIWPHALNELLGGKADAYYSVIGPIGGTGGDSTPPGFINGYMFLQRFYTAVSLLCLQKQCAYTHILNYSSTTRPTRGLDSRIPLMSTRHTG
ncbi:hypothetical protein RSAG8_12985, partial [Rhizoctonia solani AG-8 WAC10335]